MTALAILAAGLLLAQEANPVFRVSAEAVEVDVFVSRGGRALVGLGKGDFEVLDDGERREVETVEVASVPLNVALVLDTSASVAGDELSHLQSGALAFLEKLEASDRAALLTFSHHVSLDSDLTTDRRILQYALLRAEGYGATAWHDALYAGLKTVEEAPERPVVLLFTDGEDTYGWIRDDQMLPLVRQSNAVVYAIARSESRPIAGPVVSSSYARRLWREARFQHNRRVKLLRDLTDESGGRLIETDTTERLEPIFLDILAEMKTRYVLTFRPPAPIEEGWHRLEVKVRARGADVQARRGYFYEARPR